MLSTKFGKTSLIVFSPAGFTEFGSVQHRLLFMPFPVNCPDLECHKEDCPNKTFSMRGATLTTKSSTLFLAAGEQIAGIVYQPESLQGMRENLERVLQFMASKKIRMHAITSKEVLEGNLKAVMRLILALAAHYKPQSVKHHDVSYEQMPEVKSAGPSKPEAATNSKFLRPPLLIFSSVGCRFHTVDYAWFAQPSQAPTSYVKSAKALPTGRLTSCHK